MLSLLPSLLLAMSVLILPNQPNVQADSECTQDIRSGFRLLDIRVPARQIGSPVVGVDQAECYSRCCDMRTTEGCNTATMFRYQGQMVCLLVQCQPLGNCIWGKAPDGDESVAALISARQDWVAAAGSAATTEAPVNATESPAESTTGHDISQVSVTSASNITADIFVENTTSEATTARPFLPIGQPVVNATGTAAAVPVAPDARPTGIFSGGVAKVPPPTAATTKTTDDDTWGWLWNWGSNDGPTTESPATTNPPAANAGPHLDASYVFPGKPAIVPNGNAENAESPLGSHNPIGAKQNPEAPINALGGGASNIPVYDGFGRPIVASTQTPREVTSEAMAVDGGGTWGSWWDSLDSETESPVGGETDSNNGDDWDAWLKEQKEAENWDEEEKTEEEEETGQFGEMNSLNTFTPGLSNLDELPSVQESGRKLTSSDAHKHPMTGSSFLNTSPFIASHPANRPVIVAGLCSLIVMVVLVMIFMARKTCQEKDRSRYRPLREESDFSEIAYHDHPSPH
ncbi:hypothetical protein CAPTEDRAFT_221608 [Capitella teleta]|uniref:MANSC domain-containing protein n=1 Tax=Capitella teleta TaxID=283909 RepID=R7UYR0_CAPTE|nr:hypothetical protein CAPTEDRAFT_221608 [Capitella teleta]|eukprot:ELU11474.1 hypothetical protein CAPTEDRAFT_221608 [Capitella teleta]